MIAWDDTCPYRGCAVTVENVDSGYIVRHGDESLYYPGHTVFMEGWLTFVTNLHKDMPRITNLQQVLAGYVAR